jgi:hypothetical protein
LSVLFSCCLCFWLIFCHDCWFYRC